MRCPFCFYPHQRVRNTRHAKGALRRRRECKQCGDRFTTYERVDLTVADVVKARKRKGR